MRIEKAELANIYWSRVVSMISDSRAKTVVFHLETMRKYGNVRRTHCIVDGERKSIDRGVKVKSNQRSELSY